MMQRPARYWEPDGDGYVRCTLCAQYCRVKDGGIGVCGVRQNTTGELTTSVYGMLAAVNIDPIEKKPLFHMLPGSQALSLATVGCNFRCTFCQNWDLSQSSKGKHRSIRGQQAEAKDLVDSAIENSCRVIAYTYSEPTIFYEWALDVARQSTEAGILNVFVTNGYITAEPLREIAPYLHGANIDLKAFNDAAYKKVMGAPGVGPVLDTLRLMKELGIWVEVTTLVVPSRNDSDEELRSIAQFISQDLGPETPWHISRFHPNYRDTDLPSTPHATLHRAYDIGREEGLQYVYLGNVPGDDTESTRCNSCGDMLIRRNGYRVIENCVTAKSTCPSCRTTVAGVGMGEATLSSGSQKGFTQV
jgi:pyruvate formate lyase activating enzyme